MTTNGEEYEAMIKRRVQAQRCVPVPYVDEAISNKCANGECQGRVYPPRRFCGPCQREHGVGINDA
jgi:hypothetical protein